MLVGTVLRTCRGLLPALPAIVAHVYHGKSPAQRLLLTTTSRNFVDHAQRGALTAA